MFKELLHQLQTVSEQLPDQRTNDITYKMYAAKLVGGLLYGILREGLLIFHSPEKSNPSRYAVLTGSGRGVIIFNY